MLSLCRRRAASALIASVLCASVGLATSGAVGHGGEHDTLPAFVEHDASAHAFRAPTDAPEHPFHCLVCHWSRSFRHHPGGESHGAPAAAYSPRVHHAFVLVAPAARAALPPLRSPPTA
jgi:hypothetical protein